MSIQFPLMMCRSETLILVDESFFQGKFSRTAILNEKAGVLECKFLHGSGDFSWMVDADGVFYELSLSEVEHNFLQRIGFSGRWLKYKIKTGRLLDVGKLGVLVGNLHDENEDFPHVADLKEMLSRYELSHLWGAQDMRQYLCE